MVVMAFGIAARKAFALAPFRANIGKNVRTMMSRGTRGGPLKIEGAFPYKEKYLYNWQACLDTTRLKLENENAKLIVVEGPIGVGKTALAKALADEFDLYFIEDVTMDEYYINSYGYDYRQLDPQLPPNLQSMDHKKFCVDPFNRNTLRMQTNYLHFRFFHYCEALAHILNTGQGVIMDRSYFTDYVMAYSCIDEGYIKPNAKEFYDRMIYNTAFELFRPHLVIYLDIPVPVVQERIKTRGYSWEVNGKALTPSFLANNEKYYKDYIKRASENSEVLVYDWTDGGEVEAVIEDIEEIDFKAHENEFDPIYEDWKLCRRDLKDKRRQMTNDVDQIVTEVINYVRPYDQEEMWMDPDEQEIYRNAIWACPGGGYAPGYNKDQGDKGISLLWKKEKRGRFGYFYPMVISRVF